VPDVQVWSGGVGNIHTLFFISIWVSDNDTPAWSSGSIDVREHRADLQVLFVAAGASPLTHSLHSGALNQEHTLLSSVETQIFSAEVVWEVNWDPWTIHSIITSEVAVLREVSLDEIVLIRQLIVQVADQPLLHFDDSSHVLLIVKFGALDLANGICKSLILVDDFSEIFVDYAPVEHEISPGDWNVWDIAYFQFRYHSILRFVQFIND
jgi:hypothetical protein